MALPPSLDLEIQAIRQVGCASVECSGGHRGRISAYVPVQTLTSGQSSSPLSPALLACPASAQPSPEASSVVMFLLPSLVSSAPVPYPPSPFPPVISSQPHTCAPSTAVLPGAHLALALPGSDTASPSRSRMQQLLTSPVLSVECGSGRRLRLSPMRRLRTLLEDR